MKLLTTLIGLFCCTIALGQIKIGDNPQNIDASSVLELESSTRAFVITRVSDAEMNNLNPLPGALVYNTDVQCVHFYDGNTWLNLCAALGLNLTADPIVNLLPTIVITQNGDNFNFEVGEIRGQNIVDFSIGAVDIQNNSITEDKLAPDSVGSEELRDNTVADAEIDYNEVTLSDFFNDAGFITGAQIVSGAADNSITDNGGAFYDDTPLQNAIAANTAAIAADGDTDSANEIQNLTLNGNTLGISGSNTVDLSGFNNSGSDDQLLDLNGNNLSIENGNTIDLSVFTNTGTDDQNLTSATLSPANVLEINIENGNSTTVDLSSLSGTGSDDQNLTGGSLSPANVLQIDIENGTSAFIDLSPLGGTGSDDQNLTGGSLSPANVLQIDIENGNSAFIDLSALSGGGSDDQNLTGGSLSPANILQIDIENGNPATVDLSALDDPGTDDQNLTGASLGPGDILQIDIENGTSATVDLSSLAGGADDQTAAEVPFTPSGNTISNNVQAAIEEIQTEVDGISAGGAANPNDELQDLSLAGNILTLVPPSAPNTPIDLSFLIDDADADPLNELQSITSIDGSVIITPSGNDFDLSVPAGTDDQNLTGATLLGTDLTINIEDGTSTTADLSALATDAELAALPIDDADADPANELQTISLTGNDLTLSDGGGTVTIPVGVDGVVSNITTSGTELAVTGTNGGFNGNVDLEALVDAAAGNNGYLLTEVDGDITNELQTISLTGNDLTLSDGGGTVTLPAGGGGESNTASNQGSGGVGTFIAKNGVDLEFKNINAGSNKVTITNDGANNEIDIDVDESNFQISGGPGGVIVANSITQGDIGNNAIGMAEIQADAVGTSEIDTDAVTTSEILNLTIIDEDISTSASIAGTKIDPNFGAQGIVTTLGLSVGADILLNGNMVVPDYVFHNYYSEKSELKEDYVFYSLPELEVYLKNNHHLPGIKSYEQVQKEGFWNLSESNMQNLEKIEELFLHTIEQEKKISKLKAENDKLHSEMESLKKQLEEIKQYLTKQ